MLGELASMPNVPASTWLSVFALGLMDAVVFVVEFFRTRPVATPAALSLLPPRGREAGVVVE